MLIFTICRINTVTVIITLQCYGQCYAPPMHWPISLEFELFLQEILVNDPYLVNGMVNRQLKLNRSNDFYNFYCKYFSTVCKSKSRYCFSYLLKKTYVKKMETIC